MPYIGDPRTERSVSMHYDTAVSVIAVRGELAGPAVAMLQPAMEAAVAARSPVVVDLDEVSFMDSQGLYALLVLRRRLAEGSVASAIACRPRGIVDVLFAVTGTDGLFAICASRRSAIARVRR